MTTKAQAAARAAVPLPVGDAHAGPWLTPPWTLEERLQRIGALGQRIDGYVQFMCQVGSLNGTSAEAKERAVTAFLERLIVVESQLGGIQESLQLD